MGCDTNYVTPQLYQFTTQAELSYYHDYYRITSTENKGSKMVLQSNNPLTLGGYVYWGILGYGHTWTLGSGNHKAFRNSFSLNTARFIAEIYNFKTSGKTQFTNITNVDLSNKNRNFEGLSADCFGLNAEYIFNHKRYSYPAAFGENAVQRRAAGSWKLGVSFNSINIDFDRNKLPDYIASTIDTTLIFDNVSYHDYGVSFGYGYNWPFRHNCLLAVSVLPTLGYRRCNLTSQYGYILGSLSTDLVFRASLFWNNTRYFSGLILDLHTYAYRAEHFGLTNTYGTLKYVLGLNFLRKKR